MSLSTHALSRLTGAVIALGSVSGITAAQYAITSLTIDSGGGTLVGATYTLTGTIGQPDADVLAGTSYTLDGGFWPGLEGGAVCEGDANGDGSIDVNDISYVLFRLGGSPPDGDANNDGAIDVNDISYVLFRLGNSCP